MSKLDDVVDRELIDRIIRWFGEPDAPPPPPPEPESERDRWRGRTDEETAAAVNAAVFPEMVERVERHCHTDTWLRPPSTLTLRVERDMLLFRADDRVQIGIREPEEYDVSAGREMMRETAPQAVLRDLHRPVRDFSNPVVELHEVEILRPIRAEVASALRQRYSIQIDEIPRGWQCAQEALAELSEILSKPWEDAKTESLKQ